MDIRLHNKQAVAFTSTANEILYGGAAGGGKSHALRVAAIAWAYDIPGLQIYLFRRTYVDLMHNHLNGAGNFLELLAEFIDSKHVTFNISRGEFTFWNGSKIHLCHCQHENDVIKYQGAEIHVLLMDELTHFPESTYRFLRNRLRLGGLKLPDLYVGKFPKIFCGTNPGGIGHQWVKRTFIDMAKPFEIRQQSPEEGGMQRQFIPALLEDNPTMVNNDPMYEQRLTGLGSPDLVKAMRFGLWDIVAGAAFEKLSRDKHLLRNFKPPVWWTKFTSIDWGSSKPFANGWFCVADEDVILEAKDGHPEKFVPKGAIILYRELYGWNGKPDEGCRLESFEVARKILEIEKENDEQIDYRIGDSAMWARHDGLSTQERMYEGTKGKFIMEKSRKDRQANYEEMRTRLVGLDGNPLFFATENCQHFWRTVPSLVLDERTPHKGPDTNQEDHCFPAGTKIITDKGNIPIEKIKKGTKVLTTQGLLPCIPLGKTTRTKTLKITLEDGFSFEATPNHPILTERGVYLRLDELRIGDKVQCLKYFPPQNKERLNSALQNAGQEIFVVEIRGISAGKEKDVYNLSVPGPENYCLENGLIVHNCYDMVSYAIATKPVITTKKDRFETDYKQARKMAFGGKKGRYAT